MTKVILFLSLLFLFSANADTGFFVSNDKLAETGHFTIVAQSHGKQTITILPTYKSKSAKFLYILPVDQHYTDSSFKLVQPSVVTQLLSYSSPRIAEYINFDPCNKNSSTKKIKPLNNRTYRTIADNSAIGINYADFTYTDSSYKLLGYEESKNVFRLIEGKKFLLSASQKKILDDHQKNNIRYLIIEGKTNSNDTVYVKPFQLKFSGKTNFVDNLSSGYNSANHLLFLSNQGQAIPKNMPVKKLLSNFAIGFIKDISNIQTFLKRLIKANTRNNKVLLLYSWPMMLCKPCVNPIPSISDLQKLGVSWYKKPKKGTMGLIAPFAAIYLTSYYYSGIYQPLNFQITNKKDHYQLLYKTFEPVNQKDSKCEKEFSKKLLNLERIFKLKRETLTKIS